MLIIANNCENKAVWNALKLHINFIEANRENIFFIVKDKYLDIILNDYPEQTIVTYSNKIDLIKKIFSHQESKLYAPDGYSVLYASISKILKQKEIYFWLQGVAPEESYLKHPSKIKYYILSLLESLALSVSNKIIFVSQDMKKYVEQKYHKNYKKSIVVPCISEFTYDGSNKEKDSFVYIGGMSAWQRVDKMMQMFNTICTFKPEAKFYIATLEIEIAKNLMKKFIDLEFQNRVIILSIEDRSKITKFLSTKEYGFLIRDDIVVNQVSSPIKLAEYLSCGVNVIISSALDFYATEVENYKAGIKISDIEDINAVKSFCINIQNAEILYRKYFSKEQHQTSYTKLMEV